MTPSTEPRAALRAISRSVRDPAGLVDEIDNAWLVPALLLVATFGVGVYGTIMRLHLGPLGMLEGLARAPLAAGLAWIVALPSLYIVGGVVGLRLDVKRTLLAASIATCFAGLAMLASVPIAWLFGLSRPISEIRMIIHGVTFAGVGLCMSDVFLRVLNRLEPGRGRGFALLWLGLLGGIGLEMFVLLDVFDL